MGLVAGGAVMVVSAWCVVLTSPVMVAGAGPGIGGSASNQVAESVDWRLSIAAFATVTVAALSALASPSAALSELAVEMADLYWIIVVVWSSVFGTVRNRTALDERVCKVRQETWTMHSAVQSGWSDRRGPAGGPGFGQICVAMVASSHEVQENHPCVDSDAPCVQRKRVQICIHGQPAAVMTLVRGALLEAGCRGDAHEEGSEEQLGVSPGVASVFVHASGTTTMSTTGILDLLRPDCGVPIIGALLHQSAE
ncbi:uncharacterized protein LOC117194522 [Drosophila miranda]|uniref:uncharacterized protein LOC117194522 n=1 Tax=Drosophila miranda TaxID=7229 RepID=UPI00143F860A|nr:uncharacterized protein LOC117194522 [Drosophila miranda]